MGFTNITITTFRKENYQMNIKDLHGIAEKLNQSQIQYSLGGSGLLFYLGLIDKVNDWDIVVECPKEKLIEVLDDLPWSELKSGDYPYASEFRIHIPSLHIDFIGSLALQNTKGTVKFPIENAAIWHGVQVSYPEIWCVAYQMMGREHKADLLLNYLKGNRINKRLMLNFIGNDCLDDQFKQELISVMERK